MEGLVGYVSRVRERGGKVKKRGNAAPLSARKKLTEWEWGISSKGGGVNNN